MLKEYDKIAIITSQREVSFSEMLQRVSLFGQQMPLATPAEAAAPVQERKKVIIVSENREGYLYAFYAIWLNHLIPVPVDAGSTPHDIAYIINDCRPALIWTTAKRESTVREALKECGLEVPLKLIDDHERAEIAPDTAKADIKYEDDHTALIIYTSGTTGSPKGVMLSFGNILANLKGVCEDVPYFNPDRRTLILLPLHHVLPLVGTVLAPMKVGAGVAIAGAMTAQEIMGTMQRGKVGLMIGVPRLWQTLYQGMKKKIDASPVTRGLFNFCRWADQRWLSRIIFAKIHKMMGGHLEVCVSGGAALDPEIWHGLKALGIDVTEGYGMTEFAPMISFSRPGDLIPQCVGLRLPACEVVVKDGELCAKGPNLMQGYYNREKETAEIIDDEGYLHTGDLGHIDEKGHIFITGRKKEIIVLSNGKNINPSEIEFKLEAYSEMVKESGVVQDHDMLRAIIVPQKEWAEGKSDEELEQQLKRELLEPYNQTVASYKKLTSLFVYKGELPRTRIGKLQRYKLPALIISGNHTQQKEATLVEPAFPEYKIIKQYIRAEKKCVVNPTDNIETDLGFDSLDKVGLQGFLEQTFGMQITADQIGTFSNITEMAEHVADYKTRIEITDIDWNTLLNEPSEHLQLPGTWPTGPFIIKTLKAWAFSYFHIETKGVENIPLNGPCIFAPNHQSFIDGLLVMSPMSQSQMRQTYFYAKADHVYKQQWRRLVASRHNIIVMDQSQLKQSILQLGEVLKQGKNIIVFPEGTRTPDGKVGEFKKTFAILAKELNIPIIPIAISGAYEAWPKGKRFPSRKKVSIEFLPAIQPLAEHTYESLAEEVQKVIAAKVD